MAKYNSYIELSPHYESVVSIETESNHPDMWQEYIVHEDMKGAIEKICDSLKFEDEDKRRSFWIHGAYGTGKSYAAIVLKHLFEDKVDSIRKFLSEENLKDDETRRFMESSFRDGSVKTTGTDIDRLMPPISRFGGGNRAEKKQTIIEKLKGFFDRFFGIG